MRYHAALLTCVLVLACSPDTPTTPQHDDRPPLVSVEVADTNWLPPHLRALPGLLIPSISSSPGAPSLRSQLTPSMSTVALSGPFPPPIDLGGAFSSPTQASDVRADGVVIGYVGSFFGGYTGIRWSPNGSPAPGGYYVGDSHNHPQAINTSGQVAGHVYNFQGGMRAARWVGSTAAQVLAPALSQGMGINDGGTVVGYTSPSINGGEYDGVRWDASGVGSVLTPLNNLDWVISMEVNSSGQIVGYEFGVSPNPSTSRAVLWTADGTPTLLPPLAVGRDAQAYGINAGGVIVGQAIGADNRNRAVRWINGAIAALEMPPQAQSASAWDVNDDGIIVGQYYDGSLFHAAVWDGGGTFLGKLPPLTSGAWTTSAYAIEGNYAAGVSIGLNDQTHAVRWTLAEPGATAVGSNVEVAPVDPATGTSPVTLTFGSVSGAGTTTVSSSTQGAPPPLGFKLGTPPVYYELATTAEYSGSITVCFTYNPASYHNPANLKLFHGVAGVWTNVTTSHDQASHVICGTTTSLSPFILAELLYDFTGFFQPVDNGTVLNQVKAGSGIPVKFSLGGALGLDVLTANSPTTGSISCTSVPGVDPIEELTTSTSGLHYEDGQYIYVWKTQSTWKGTCRKLMLNLKDGTQHVALFQFK